MKKFTALLIAILMIMTMSFVVTSCGGKDTEEEVTPPAETTEEAGAEAEEPETETEEDVEDVVTVFEPDGEDIGDDLPLQIESVTLYKDGTVKIVPLDDLKKNAESNNELKEDGAIYPFAESGKIRKLYLMKLGNGGFRTLVAVTEENTISAVNPQVLIQDRLAVVMDNLGGRDNFVEVEQEESEDGFSIRGISEDGSEAVLDPVLLSDEARQTADDEE